MKIDLFSTPIYSVSIPPTDDEYTALDTVLMQSFSTAPVNSWALETGKSTGSHDLYLYSQPQMQWLISKTIPHVYTFWQQLNYRHDAEIRITSSWSNLHQYKQTTGQHNHCGGAIKAHISAVYYFKKPPLSGDIEFVDPMAQMHKMTPVHEYSEVSGSMYKAISAKQFDLILFPSWLMHRTQPNLSQEDRVSISMNFKGKWNED
jgi:uncharacterized protein (TIGR02466 family)